VAKYLALILGLQMGIKMGMKDLDIYADLQLAIKQFLEEHEVKNEALVPYHKYALQLLDKLEIVKLKHVPSS